MKIFDCMIYMNELEIYYLINTIDENLIKNI